MNDQGRPETNSEVSTETTNVNSAAAGGAPLPGAAAASAAASAASNGGQSNWPPRPQSSVYRSLAPKLIALLAAIVAALIMREFLTESSDQTGSPGSSSRGISVGEIQSVEGQVLIRPPRGMRFEVARPGPYFAESVLQTQAASAAVIEFRPGPTLRLLENSRLVAEIDSSRDGAIQVTVLAGEVAVLNPGANPLFTLLHNGVSIPFRNGETPMPRTVPLIELGPTIDETTVQTSDLEEKIEIEKESEAQAAPTVDLETLVPAATATPQGDPRVKSLPEKNAANSLLRSTLTNDDIRTQLRAQAGSFQKCYVTMVNRMSESGVSAGALPKGEVSVAFKILPIGKVEDAVVKKSPFKDSTFERCVSEALGRLRFRQFQGAAIPVGDFPITLE